MSIEKFLVAGSIEPLALTIEQTQQATGESRTQVYARIGTGEYQAVKSGRRTLIISKVSSAASLRCRRRRSSRRGRARGPCHKPLARRID